MRIFTVQSAVRVRFSQWIKIKRMRIWVRNPCAVHMKAAVRAGKSGGRWHALEKRSRSSTGNPWMAFNTRPAGRATAASWTTLPPASHTTSFCLLYYRLATRGVRTRRISIRKPRLSILRTSAVWQLQPKVAQTVQQHCLVWVYLDT